MLSSWNSCLISPLVIMKSPEILTWYLNRFKHGWLFSQTNPKQNRKLIKTQIVYLLLHFWHYLASYFYLKTVWMIIFICMFLCRMTSTWTNSWLTVESVSSWRRCVKIWSNITDSSKQPWLSLLIKTMQILLTSPPIL